MSPSPLAIAIGAGGVWVTGDHALTRIDPQSARVVGRPIPVGDDSYSVAVGAGGVWVANNDAGRVTHVAPYVWDRP